MLNWDILIASFLFLALLVMFIFIGNQLKNIYYNKNHKSIIDDITGLPHFDSFKKLLQKKMNNPSPFSITLLNIDEFKTFHTLNNTRARNELLRQIGQRLTNSLSSSGSVSRIEGGQFMVLRPYSTKPFQNTSIGADHSQEMYTLLSAPYLIENKLCHVTISIGTAIYKGENLTLDQLILETYKTLKPAKENGYLQTAHYHEMLTEQVRRCTFIEVYLRSALLEDQLSLQYQPQYELQNGKLRGFEALLRWNHPELGAIPPSEFIPIAEDTRLIIPIGLWVLRQACEMLQRTAPSPSKLTISVNISGIQLLVDQFPDDVISIIKQTGIDPARIELELTESTLFDTLDVAERQLKKLQELGIQLALDDFGTGYSSMNYLRKLPFNLIKIDKSFIQDIAHSIDQDVTGAMIQFIKQLRYGIVAEGLETYEQLVYLKKFQCDYAQGYLFSHPLPEEQLPSLIQADPL